MPRTSVDVNFLFTLGELQRLVRAYADKEAARFGMTRAQWAVLAKVERNEGLKQSELAEQMEMQPITLTRLIDKLAEAGLIERRQPALSEEGCTPLARQAGGAARRADRHRPSGHQPGRGRTADDPSRSHQRKCQKRPAVPV